MQNIYYGFNEKNHYHDVAHNNLMFVSKLFLLHW